MTQETTPDGMLDKDAMKALRAERKAWIEAASVLAREAKTATAAVRQALAAGPETAPGIARASGLSPDKALWIVASMKKFGQIVEAEKDGGFYRYALADGPTPDTE
jgi:hypothetical protein